MALPIMDGWASLQVLARMNPNLKIIAASGLKTNAAVAHEADSSIRYLLDKPYGAATLLKTLQVLLNEHLESDQITVNIVIVCTVRLIELAITANRATVTF